MSAPVDIATAKRHNWVRRRGCSTHTCERCGAKRRYQSKATRVVITYRAPGSTTWTKVRPNCTGRQEKQ